MIFLTSDTHFGNDISAWKYRNRPFDNAEEADIKMVELWNKYVTKEDTVYHLGDFAITNEALENFVSQLNYKEIFLVVGNHDYKRDRNILSKYFNVIDNPFVFDIPAGYNTYGEGDQLWFCHYPLQKHDELYSAFGHVHEAIKVAKRGINVGVDVWHFRPVDLQKVIDCRYAENNGYWDANVYPDTDLDWKIEVSSKIKRDTSGNEPTMKILKDQKEREWMLQFGDDAFYLDM